MGRNTQQHHLRRGRAGCVVVEGDACGQLGIWHHLDPLVDDQASADRIRKLRPGRGRHQGHPPARNGRAGGGRQCDPALARGSTQLTDVQRGLIRSLHLGDRLGVTEDTVESAGIRSGGGDAGEQGPRRGRAPSIRGRRRFERTGQLRRRVEHRQHREALTEDGGERLGGFARGDLGGRFLPAGELGERRLHLALKLLKLDRSLLLCGGARDCPFG